MRVNFYELLSQRDFNVRREYNTLYDLFTEEKNVCYRGARYSLFEFVDRFLFRQFSFRESRSSLRQMMTELGIEYYPYGIDIDIELLLLFSELLISVLPVVDLEFLSGYEDQKKVIMGNIEYILEKTNHEIREDEKKRRIIVQKNQLTTLAAEVVSDQAIAFDMIEYNHFSIKGHLDKKRKLLTSLANYIEPLLKSTALQNGGYKALQTDAGFVLNNFHIRHNNKEGKTKQEYVANLSDSELEEWYDKAYEIILTVIIVNDYLSIHAEIDELKKKLHGGQNCG